MRDQYKIMLENQILPFWMNLIDEEFGGFYGLVDEKFNLNPKGDKGAILNSRILWTFSSAYRQLKNKAYLKYAEQAYEFLKNAFIDKEYKGVYWMIDYTGKAVDTRKHIYNIVFAIYGLSEYYRATNHMEALNLAKDLFFLVEEKGRDEFGYLEEFDRYFNKTSNEKLSEAGVVAEKTMNTHLHVLEAYTNLHRVWKDERLSECIRNILNVFKNHIYDPKTNHLLVFFDQQWNSLIDLKSYGHDIEASWLLDEAAEELGDEALLEETKSYTKLIAETILKEAYVNQSLLNEMVRDHLDEDRIWWVQAEGVVGFYNHYQKTCDDRFKKSSFEIFDFIQKYLVTEMGEWVWSVDKKMNPNQKREIVGPWKCPYHNGRMCIEMLRRMDEAMIHEQYFIELEKQEQLLKQKNRKKDRYTGLFDRYVNPVLTNDHVPLFWKYDLNKETNPYFIERLGINAVFNPGAIYLNGKFYLVARVEGYDRKSFFAIAESDNGIDNFRFWDYPIDLPDTQKEETNIYDMRLVKHQDGWIYGVFCSESKDQHAPSGDLSSATAQAGIVRTKDLVKWERLPNLQTKSPQQRNVVLHPEFVEGKYAFYTRPQDGFIETGSGSGICFGLCEDILNPIVDKEVVVSLRKYHTITEAKNGQGPAPIKTEKGWLHMAHGVRNTAAGLRYVLYAFVTDLNDPKRLIKEPGGYILAPIDEERIGDVSNVLFSNGWVVTENNEIFLYYASSDTRCHVVTTTVDKLLDYCFNTPQDPLRSLDCVKQRNELISQNLQLLKNNQ